MLDLIIFTQYPGAHAPKRFAEESIFKGLSFKVVGYDRIDLNDLPDGKIVILREPTAKNNIYDLRDKILKHYFGKSKILNQKSYLKWSILDKITQHKEFKKAGIPHIKLQKLENSSFPFIAKNKLGSHGSSVFKIENKNDLDKVFAAGYNKKNLLIQGFQTSGFDLRVIVLGRKVLEIMKRTPKKGNFLSNYSQGGSVESYRDTSDRVLEIKKIAIKVARHFKLDYCGVDLMKGNDDEWKVLEVNRACQFRGFEKATGVNVARNVLEFLKK